MGTIGLKIKDRTYDRLKWLKTRFEFVHETTMSWDEFFERISRDVLLILAHDLKERSVGDFSAEDIFTILVGSRGKTVKDKDDEGELFSALSSDVFNEGDELFNSLSDLKKSVRRDKSGKPAKM